MSAAGAETRFRYDSKGNLCFDGTWYHIYDAENRLMVSERRSDPSLACDDTTATVTERVTYAYGPSGRRLLKDNDLTSTEYLYEGDEPIADYDGPTGRLLRRYMHGARIDERALYMDYSSGELKV